MIFAKHWQRYFLREILKVFFLFLTCFFLLYVLVDYSTHMQQILKNKRISLSDMLYYYGMLFSKRCDLLLPLSLLIASVKVLASLNKRNELMALQTSGIPLHVLTRPFFFVGLICVGISYFNFEVLTPRSLDYIDHFEEKYLKNKTAGKRQNTAVHAISLEDGSRILYQKYVPEEKEFFDLFWVISTDEIYHMKTLTLSDHLPIGTFVDHIKRNEKGILEKISSSKSYTFDNLPIYFDLKKDVGKSMENRPISELLQISVDKKPLFYQNYATVKTHLYFKTVMPWLPVLVLIGVIPFCVPSVRHLPTFLIFAMTIFGYIAFFTIMDAFVILGEMEVVPPFWAIFSVPILFFAFFGTRFLRLCVR